MCGILGVVGTPQAAQQVLQGLTLLQHRGQDAAGILSHDERGFHLVRNLGLVDQVFNSDALRSLTGTIALGHVRYATAGKSELTSVQPFLSNYPFGIGIVHNGNLVNHRRLSRELQEESRRHPLSTSDTEVILNLLAESLSRSDTGRIPTAEGITAAVGEVMKRTNGSYSIVSLIAGFGLIAFRDPHGIRPLVHARRKDTAFGTSHLFASESGVATFLDYTEVEDVGPGELWMVTLDGQVIRRQILPRAARPCMFEWVYFASPQSDLEGSPVYQARIHLGRELAGPVRREIQEGRIRPDLIVPVPETARIAAIALSEELGIPYREVLIKNRYISRTFILDSQSKRERAVQLKIAPVVSELQGKSVLLVDDSIVRGTTSRKLIELVRHAGAREVYFVSTAPPIAHPCFYGIDFPMRSELVASERSREQIEKVLGADRVIYQTEESLVRAIHAARRLARSARGLSPVEGEFEPCMACITGKYPTSIAESSELIEARLRDRKEGAHDPAPDA